MKPQLTQAHEPKHPHLFHQKLTNNTSPPRNLLFEWVNPSEGSKYTYQVT